MATSKPAPAAVRKKRTTPAASTSVAKVVKEVAGHRVLGIEMEQTLSKYSGDSMLEYGSEVVEQRAIPDYRDGLKPVHRMLVWAAYKMGNHNNKGFKKSARLVGETLGKYHPHGDCLRGNTKIPLLNGEIREIASLVGGGKKWVLALDEDTRELVPALAHSWREGQRTSKMYRIGLTSGESIEATANHPFYVKGKGWVTAENIRVGATLAGGTWNSNSPYPYIKTNLNFASTLHSIVGTFKHGPLHIGEVFHHTDEDTKNNKPSNVEKLCRATHAEHHGHYYEGLASGLAAMVGKGGAFRKATKKKNGTLMRIHNENLWLTKAFKAVNLLISRGTKPTVSAYDGMRSEIYNLTTLVLLEERGYNLKRLVAEAKTFTVDYSSAKGFTKKIHKARLLSARNSKQGRKRFKDGHIPGLMYKAIAKVGKRLVRSHSMNWVDYEKTARVIAGSTNASRVVYADPVRLQDAFDVNSVEGLFSKVPAHHLNMVLSVEVVELSSVEKFYDFTVDTHSNMVVLTSDGDKTGNFVIAHNSSIYSALVGMAGTKFQGKESGWATRNSSTPLFEGKGNWGDFVDSPAASRYTEVKLSRFSDMFLLDPDYLAVMDMIFNYDESEQVPVILPAKVPVVLLNGFSSIAVGVAGASPPFALPGVLTLTRKALKGDKVTINDCVKHLVPDYPYGGECVSDDASMAEVMKGKGSASYIPTYEVNQKERTVTFTSVCPGLMSPRAIQTFLEKLAMNKRVAHVDDDTDKKGVRYVVQASRGIVGAALDDLAEELVDIAVRSESYFIGITMRQPDGTAKFKSSNVVEIFTLWAAWRLDVEVKVLHRLISIQKKKLGRQELLLTAVDNLDIIVKSLRLKTANVEMEVNGETRSVDCSTAHLMHWLKITFEQANHILDMRIRQLRAMERTTILAAIKVINLEIKTLNVYLKDPKVRILENLSEIEQLKL